MRPRRGRRAFAAGIVALAAVPALTAAAPVGAFANRNRVLLPSAGIRTVGQVHCGLIRGRWVPGAIVHGPASAPGQRWFISRSQQAVNFRAAARTARPAWRVYAYLRAAARLRRLAVEGTRPGHACATLPRPTTTHVPDVVAMPSGSMPGWRQVFADDFSRSIPLGAFPAANAGLWGASYPDGTATTYVNGRPKGQYWPSKTVSQSGGRLNMFAHTQGGIPMTAGLLPTLAGATGSGGGQTYGRYQFRFNVDPAPGYKTTFLLWPDSGNYLADGEIDFPEFDWTAGIWGHLHRRGASSGSDFAAVATGVAAASGWHTATITWLPDFLRFTLDGRTALTVTGSAVPDRPMHMVIQSETYTTSSTPPPTGAAGYLRLDWLVISKPA